jgi:cytochrome c553
MTMPCLSRALPALLALGIAAALAPQAQADAAAGRQLAGTCRVCHGLDGVGTNPTVPNIGGQSEMYLVKQLQDFRDGRREDPQMSIVVQGLTDQQIRDLAAWYASIKATFTLPE